MHLRLRRNLPVLILFHILRNANLKTFLILPSDCLLWFSVDYKISLLGTFRYASLTPHKSFGQPTFQ